MRFVPALSVLACAALAGCGGGGASAPLPCDAAPEIRRADGGIEFVRTPDSCFAELPGWPYEARYVAIDGLRQALGMGRSDKPIDIGSYSYLGHHDRLLRFIEALDLREINLFVQDWGSVIGLRVAGLHPDLFARIAVGDGMLPVVPAGLQPYPAVEDPDEIADIPPLFAALPPRQPPFHDGRERRGVGRAHFLPAPVPDDLGVERPEQPRQLRDAEDAHPLRSGRGRARP